MDRDRSADQRRLVAGVMAESADAMPGGRHPYASPTIDTMIELDLRGQADLDESLIAAYGTSNNATHATGLRGFDGVTLGGISAYKVAAASGMAQSLAFLSNPVLNCGIRFPGMDPGVVREKLREEVDWAAPKIIAWVEADEQKREEGMRLAPTLTSLLSLHQFTYAPELGLTHPYTLHKDDRKVVTPLFGAEALRSGVPVNDVSLGLRVAGITDVSEERLTRRLENTLDVMQIETSMVCLRYLESMWFCGGAVRDAAVRIFGRNRGRLLQNNSEAKEAIMAEAAEALEALRDAGRVSGTPHKIAGNLAYGMRKFLGDCQGVRDMFATIYQGLGYDVPAVLQPHEAAEELETAVDEAAEAVGSLATETMVAPPSPDPEVVNAFRSRAAELTARALKTNQAWTMDNRARERTGLTAAVRILMRSEGCRTATGQPLLPRMDRHTAEELVAVLRQLIIIGGREPAVAQRQLTGALTREVELSTDIARLCADIQRDAPSADIDMPTAVPVSGYVAGVQKEWSFYRQVLISIWPQNQIEEALRNLECIRDLPPDGGSAPATA